MRERLRGIARWIAWVGGVFFAAAAATVLVLTMTGSVGADRWTGAVEVLRGTAMAVETAELARLEAAKKESEELRRAKEDGEVTLLDSWRKLQKEKERFAERRKMESDEVKKLARLAESHLDNIRIEKQKWAEQEAAEEQREQRAREDVKRRGSDKVKRVYRYMEPAAVAADLESRLASGKDDEVAELVREMSDRSA
ncbi:MAG: hypothetical protein ACYSU0_19995, partial [Planctomycetota bacterium]